MFFLLSLSYIIGFCEEYEREQSNISQKRQLHLLRVVLGQAKAHDSSVSIINKH